VDFSPLFVRSAKANNPKEYQINPYWVVDFSPLFVRSAKANNPKEYQIKLILGCGLQSTFYKVG
jgi:hypothetical protein